MDCLFHSQGNLTLIRFAPAASFHLKDFSNVFGHNSYAAFPRFGFSSTGQKQRTLTISQLKKSPGNYNPFNSEYCTMTVNQILEAAGLGSNLLYSVPSRNIQYLSDIEKALALDRKAKFTTDGAGNRIPIPEALRGLQRDYAYPGGGYDTPSERIGRVLPGGENNDSPGSCDLAERHRADQLFPHQPVLEHSATASETGARRSLVVQEIPFLRQCSSRSNPRNRRFPT